MTLHVQVPLSSFYKFNISFTNIDVHITFQQPCTRARVPKKLTMGTIMDQIHIKKQLHIENFTSHLPSHFFQWLRNLMTSKSLWVSKSSYHSEIVLNNNCDKNEKAFDSMI